MKDSGGCQHCICDEALHQHCAPREVMGGDGHSAERSPTRRKCISRQASHSHPHCHGQGAQPQSHCREIPSQSGVAVPGPRYVEAPLLPRSTAPAVSLHSCCCCPGAKADPARLPPLPLCRSHTRRHKAAPLCTAPDVLLPKQALLPVKVIHTDCNCQSVIKGKARSASLKATMQTNKDSLFPALWVRPAGTTQSLALLGERSDSAPAHGTSRSLCRVPALRARRALQAPGWLCPPYAPSSGSPAHHGSLWRQPQLPRQSSMRSDCVPRSSSQDAGLGEEGMLLMAAGGDAQRSGMGLENTSSFKELQEARLGVNADACTHPAWDAHIEHQLLPFLHPSALSKDEIPSIPSPPVPSWLTIYHGCRSRVGPGCTGQQCCPQTTLSEGTATYGGSSRGRQALIPSCFLFFPSPFSQSWAPRGDHEQKHLRGATKKATESHASCKAAAGERWGAGVGTAGDCSGPWGLSPTAVVPQMDALCAHRPGSHTHAVNVSSPSFRCDNLLWTFFKGKNLT